MELPQLLKPEDITDFTEEETKQIRDFLSNPLIQRYFKTLYLNAQSDLLVNEIETAEQENKFLARFAKFKGVQYICAFIEGNFGSKSAV